MKEDSLGKILRRLGKNKGMELKVKTFLGFSVAVVGRVYHERIDDHFGLVKTRIYHPFKKRIWLRLFSGEAYNTVRYG